jgi:hypothetical protein
MKIETLELLMELTYAAHESTCNIIFPETTTTQLSYAKMLRRNRLIELQGIMCELSDAIAEIK